LVRMEEFFMALAKFRGAGAGISNGAFMHPEPSHMKLHLGRSARRFRLESHVHTTCMPKCTGHKSSAAQFTPAAEPLAPFQLGWLLCLPQLVLP